MHLYIDGTDTKGKVQLAVFSSKYTGTVSLNIGHRTPSGRWVSKRVELEPLQAQELARALQQADRERLAACGYR